MTLRRVLILTASVGSGHTRAAQAVEAAIQEQGLAREIELVDVLKDASSPFRAIYSRGYVACIARAPTFVGWAYNRTDRPWAPSGLRGLVEDTSLRALRHRIAESDADAVVCTHFLAAGVVARMRARSLRVPWLGVVVTDLHPHALWLHRGIDRYFVATPEAAEYLRTTGLSEDHVLVTGIPIDPCFSDVSDRLSARRALGVPTDRPFLLYSTGGLGMGPVDQAVRQLMDALPFATIVVVCGRNDDLRARLGPLSERSGGRCRVLGFTRQMHDLMAAADLCIGKPGGLTSAECLARGLPMILVDAVPGQEDRNAEHLLEIGAAIRCRDRSVVGWKVAALLNDPQRLRRMRVNAACHGRPAAARIIAEDVASRSIVPRHGAEQSEIACEHPGATPVSAAVSAHLP